MKLTTSSLILCVIAIAIDLTTSQKVYLPQQGSVLGAIDETLWTQQKFFAFLGIPYAQSPSGKLRFQPPQSRAPWNDTLDVSKDGRACPNFENTLRLNATQREDEDLEDCLNLRVYSKDLSAKQPVMFYTHGGGFGGGLAKAFPPHFLLEKDVVLVVAQYRLGSLGFMTTFTDEMPGNVAIMDIQLALQWVHKYIDVFGGDPNHVTIFGQSAGAAMTSAVVISPKTSVDLFKKSILQSASILSPWAINRYALQQAKRVCEGLDCGLCNDVKKMNECMLKADLWDLLKAASKEKFSPVIGDVFGVLPDEPKKLIANFNRTIPLMAGFTKHDGSFLVPEKVDLAVEQYGSMENTTVRQFAYLLIEEAQDNTDLAYNLILQMFFKEEILDEYNHTAALPAYFDIANDVNIKSPVIAYATAMQRKVTPVYMYSFDYAGQHKSRAGGRFDPNAYPFDFGVTHGSDYIYLFDLYLLNEDDTAFAKKMVNLWYSFAADGEPKDIDQPALTIKPMETESGPYFNINKEVTLRTDILTELTAVLDDPESYKLIKSVGSGVQRLFDAAKYDVLTILSLSVFMHTRRYYVEM